MSLVPAPAEVDVDTVPTEETKVSASPSSETVPAPGVSNAPPSAVDVSAAASSPLPLASGDTPSDGVASAPPVESADASAATSGHATGQVTDAPPGTAEGSGRGGSESEGVSTAPSTEQATHTAGKGQTRVPSTTSVDVGDQREGGEPSVPTEHVHATDVAGAERVRPSTPGETAETGSSTAPPPRKLPPVIRLQRTTSYRKKTVWEMSNCPHCSRSHAPNADGYVVDRRRVSPAWQSDERA